jgi:hypothetical protein
MASSATGGWPAKLRTNNLPLAVAVQGLALVLLAFLFNAPPQQDVEGDTAGTGWLAEDTPPRLISEPRIPADLHPEQLRLPRFPDPKQHLRERQPAPPVNPPIEIRTLGALRVDSVSIQAPTTIQAVLTLPNIPDHLEPGTISLRRFGDGAGRSGRSDGRGWGGIGGVGVGGVGVGGMGDGDRCHPVRPGSLTNPRNPISGPPPVIEQTTGYPY